jgi:hypothetical protein
MWKKALTIPACLALAATAFVGVTKLESRTARAETPAPAAPPAVPAPKAPAPEQAQNAAPPMIVDLDADGRIRDVDRLKPRKSGRRAGKLKALSGY